MKTSEQINELAAALVKAQSMMKPAKKSEANPYFKSKYADLSNIMENDRKALTSNGLCIVQGANIGGDKDGVPQMVGVTTRLIHTSGQWIEDTAGAASKDFGPQAVGATLTYLRRYGYSALVGATAEGEDDDGETAEGRPPDRNEARRKAVMDRFAALKDYLTDDEKAHIKKTTSTLNDAELESYVARFEKKLHTAPKGAGVADEKVIF